jgi:L-ascorbate metabolism protein UlaG (beta-lactamase superfamily)
MKLTKYEHACLVIEEQAKRLIIDPGMFNKDFSDHEDVCAVVITHGHPDHFDPKVVERIIKANPGAKIFTIQAVADELKNPDRVMVVKPMQTVSCGPFQMSFCGGLHAEVHSSFDAGKNVGILVNQKLYYPGDSFSLPEGNMKPSILAVPTSGPFMRYADSIDFVLAVKPKLAFPTHDIHSSDAGDKLIGDMLTNACNSIGAEYKPLKTAETIEI